MVEFEEVSWWKEESFGLSLESATSGMVADVAVPTAKNSRVRSGTLSVCRGGSGAGWRCCRSVEY